MKSPALICNNCIFVYFFKCRFNIFVVTSYQDYIIVTFKRKMYQVKVAFPYRCVHNLALNINELRKVYQFIDVPRFFTLLIVRESTGLMQLKL